MFKLAVINSKGGAGKTTLSTNLASYFAANHLKTTIIDYDSQGSSSFWVEQRPEHLPAIDVIPAYQQVMSMTRSFFLRPKAGTERVIIDSASGLDLRQFHSTLTDVNAILIPVLPSKIDIHAVAHFVEQLLKLEHLHVQNGNIALVANRIKKNTLIYQQLQAFIKDLGLPCLADFRDSQNYIRASEQGVGLFDMPEKTVKKDLEQWQGLLNWLAEKQLQSEAASTSIA